MSGMNGTKEIRNFLIGLGLGVGVALLFAPRSGEELRDEVTERARELAESTREKFYRLRKRAEEESEDLTGTSFR